MFTKIIQSTTLIIATAMAAAPLVSQAATAQAVAPVHATYETTLEPVFGPPSPWTGTLQLTFNANNIIQGYYHPADNVSAFIPVTGGRDGDNVWLDIGRSGRLHVTGVLANGAITGGAVDLSTQQQYKFSAKLAR